MPEQALGGIPLGFWINWTSSFLYMSICILKTRESPDGLVMLFVSVATSGCNSRDGE